MFKGEVSFIIPLFNHVKQTREMLGSLMASLPNGLDFEVILVDDASTDETSIWLEALNDSRVRWFSNEINRGYACTTNRGVSLATAAYICLLNNDLLFEPGWLEPMLEVYQLGFQNVGLVGNLQYRIADDLLDHAGIYLNPNAKFDHVRALDDADLTTKTVLAVTGACMLLRKEDFLAVGGFDEGFINGVEDLDLCFKLRLLGKEIYLAERSRIRHHVSLSRGKTNAQDELNSRRFFSRWRPQIKAALASIWYDKLNSGSKAFPDLLDGELTAEFLANRALAAEVIAESFLNREEAHWIRLFRHVGEAPKTPELCAVDGVVPDLATGEVKVIGRAIFIFSGVSRSANFFICGHTTASCEKYPLSLVIDVNGIQISDSVLDTGTSVNVGILNPIIICGQLTRFEVTVASTNSRAQRLDGIDNTLVVSHVVLDDRIYPITGITAPVF